MVKSNKYTSNYPVGLRKTVKNREDKLGVPVGIVGQEHTHGVHEHLVQAAREHGLGKFPEVFLQKACNNANESETGWVK